MDIQPTCCHICKTQRSNLVLTDMEKMLSMPPNYYLVDGDFADSFIEAYTSECGVGIISRLSNGGGLILNAPVDSHALPML